MRRRLLTRLAVLAFGLTVVLPLAPASPALATPSIPIPPPVAGPGHAVR